jgi:lipopolysaccharide biosynthesis regulator YciM
MVAYRAETAMVNILRETMSRSDDARKLLQAIYTTDADLVPDLEKNILTVRLHHLANHTSGVAIRHLCSELNLTETIFPDTDLRLVYELIS